ALEYEQALVLANRTIALGISEPAQLVQLELLAGRLAAGLDHADTAQAHFARALAIDPTVSLEAGTSPKLQAPFDAARATKPTLEVTFDRGAGSVTAIIQRDPIQLVAGVGVLVHGEAAWRVTRGHAYAIARDTTLDRVAVTDEHGNQLVVSPAPLVGSVSIGNDGRVPIAAVPLSRRWTTYTAASAVLLAGAGACAWRYGVAQDAWNRENDGFHDYSRLRALEDRGQRWAIAADIGFGLAAITGVTAAILFATRHDESEVGVAFTGTGASFVARF
ncbi:MAG: hypothetical protein ABI678_21855, partial [Kofleriaceae bacterium]